MHHPTDRIAHTTAFITPVVEHWLEREVLDALHSVHCGTSKTPNTLRHTTPILTLAEKNFPRLNTISWALLTTVHLAGQQLGAYLDVRKELLNSEVPNSSGRDEHLNCIVVTLGGSPGMVTLETSSLRLIDT